MLTGMDWSVTSTQARAEDGEEMMMNLDPVPGHAVDAADVRAGEALEDGNGDVEVVDGAAHAAVLDGDDGALAVVVDLDLAAAEGVVVGVAAGGLGVEEFLGDGHDGVGLRVEDAAGAEPGGVEGQVTSVCLAGLEGRGGDEAGGGAEGENNLGESLHFDCWVFCLFS
jgi:hypothetical protein